MSKRRTGLSVQFGVAFWTDGRPIHYVARRQGSAGQWAKCCSYEVLPNTEGIVVKEILLPMGPVSCLKCRELRSSYEMVAHIAERRNNASSRMDKGENAARDTQAVDGLRQASGEAGGQEPFGVSTICAGSSVYGHGCRFVAVATVYVRCQNAAAVPVPQVVEVGIKSGN